MPAVGSRYDGIDELLGPVTSWRLREFLRLGFDDEVSEFLSGLPHVDLHQAEDLLKQGCPHALATRILV